MIDLHLSAFAPRWRFLYAVRIDAYASRESPERMLCAAKIIDRHLGEQKLLEMAAFLYAGRFDAYLTLV